MNLLKSNTFVLPVTLIFNKLIKMSKKHNRNGKNRRKQSINQKFKTIKTGIKMYNI